MRVKTRQLGEISSSLAPKPKHAYNLPQQGNRAAYITAAGAQMHGLLMKESRQKILSLNLETKSSAPQHSDIADTSEKA